jgi:hypothetical protein
MAADGTGSIWGCLLAVNVKGQPARLSHLSGATLVAGHSELRQARVDLESNVSDAWHDLGMGSRWPHGWRHHGRPHRGHRPNAALAAADDCCVDQHSAACRRGLTRRSWQRCIADRACADGTGLGPARYAGTLRVARISMPSLTHLDVLPVFSSSGVGKPWQVQPFTVIGPPPPLPGALPATIALA